MGQFAILKAEIADDPLGRGYAAMTHAEILTSLMAADRTIQRAVPIAQVLRWSASIDAIYTLREASSSGPKDQRRLADAALQLVNHPHIADLDVTDVEIQGMLNALVLMGVFVQADIDALMARGHVTISRAAELGISGVREGYIQRARA